MRMEALISKGLRLKAHRVVNVAEHAAAGELVIHPDRLGHRRRGTTSADCGEHAGHLLVAPWTPKEKRPNGIWSFRHRREGGTK